MLGDGRGANHLISIDIVTSPYRFLLVTYLTLLENRQGGKLSN